MRAFLVGAAAGELLLVFGGHLHDLCDGSDEVGVAVLVSDESKESVHCHSPASLV